MKYTITYTCGHTEDKQLYGKHSERERRIATLESFQCPTCRAKAAQEAATSVGLPKLTGSDKQVAWASDIRDEVVEKATKTTDAALPKYRDAIAGWISDFFAARTRAAWWIDHGKSGSQIEFHDYMEAKAAALLAEQA